MPQCRIELGKVDNLTSNQKCYGLPSDGYDVPIKSMSGDDSDCRFRLLEKGFSYLGLWCG